MATQVQHQLEPWSQLPAKIVLVTGASSGLGLEFCLDLAEAGCFVIAAARRTDRLESLCDQINKMGGVTRGGSRPRAAAVALDIAADGPTIEAAVLERIRTHRCVDQQCWCKSKRSSLELADEEWSNVMKTNSTGSWMVSKYVGARMCAAARGGSIINITSCMSVNRVYHSGAVAYSSSKSGIDTMTKIMAMELGKYNIRVNSIAAGLFKSEITEGLMQQKWLKNVGERTVPLRNFGTSNPALTSLIRYLIHHSSTYVSGNIFIADAGYSLPAFPIFSSL